MTVNIDEIKCEKRIPIRDHFRAAGRALAEGGLFGVSWAFLGHAMLMGADVNMFGLGATLAIMSCGAFGVVAAGVPRYMDRMELYREQRCGTPRQLNLP